MPRPARRAAPLPLLERRAALVEATLPLLREHGTAVSTRQIAAAARVAEGTIFRAFGSKDALLQAAVARAFDLEPVLAELAGIGPTGTLDERLVAAVRILQERLNDLFTLMVAMRMHRPPDDHGDHGDHPGSGHGRPAHAGMLDAIARLAEPDRDLLRCSPAELARMLRLVTFAGTHPRIADQNPLTAEEIVSLVLDGVRERSC